MAGELLPGQLSEGIDSPATGRYGVGYIYMTGVGVDTNTFTIDGDEYELDTAGDGIVGAGVEVDDSAAIDAVTTVDAIVTDVNGDAGKKVTVVDMGAVAALIADDPSTAGNMTLAETLANGDRSAATLVGGEARDLIPLERVAYTVTAQDVTTLADALTTGIPIGCIDLGIATANLGLYGFVVQRGGVMVSPNTTAVAFVTVTGTKSVIRLTDAGAVFQAGDTIRMLISAQ